MALSTVKRVARGSAVGALIALILLGIGLFGWLLGLLLGVERDSSLDGFGTIAPLLVLSTSLAGAIVGSLWKFRITFIGALCVGTCAAGVVVGGIVLGFYLAELPNMEFTAGTLLPVALAAVALGAGIGHGIRHAQSSNGDADAATPSEGAESETE